MHWFQNLPIRTKLLIGFFIVTLIAGVIGYMGIRNLMKVNTQFTEIQQVNVEPLGQIGTAATDFQRIRVNIRDSVMNSGQPEAIRGYREKIAKYEKEIDDNLAQFEKTIRSDAIKKEYAEFEKANTQFTPIRDKIIDLAEEGKTKESLVLMRGEGLKLATAVQERVDKLVEMKTENARQKSDENIAAAKKTVNLMWTLLIIGVVIAVIIALAIARLITAPVQQLAAAADQLAQGDLSVDLSYKSKDEIGHLYGSIGTVVSTLQGVVKEAAQLTKAATEGELSYRGNHQQYAGAYRELVAGLNGVMDAVVKPLNEAAQVLDRMAQNDLTARMLGDYQGDFAQVKKNLNNACEALEGAISSVLDISQQVADSSAQVAQAVENVGKASQDVAQGSQQVAAGSGEQTRLATEAATNMEQLQRAIEEVARGIQVSATGAAQSTDSVQSAQLAVKQIVDAAEVAHREANNAGEVAEQGAQVVQQTVANMERVRSTSSDARVKVTALGEASTKIGQIVQAINDIAEQTNLLALNAAIEAARAGEHGKGFAVVADEVRKLAERSSRQTKEIDALIQGIQSGIESAVNAMEAGAMEVEQGVEMVNKTGTALTDILSAVEQAVKQVNTVSTICSQVTTNTNDVRQAVENVSSATEQVNAATEEMAASSTEVTKAVEQVVTIIEQSSATAEELAAAAEEQNASVEELTALSHELAGFAERTRQQLEQFRISQRNTNERMNPLPRAKGSGHASSRNVA